MNSNLVRARGSCLFKSAIDRGRVGKATPNKSFEQTVLAVGVLGAFGTCQ
jgi:hypothetical protein